jgi:hypothetical protein
MNAKYLEKYLYTKITINQNVTITKHGLSANYIYGMRIAFKIMIFGFITIQRLGDHVS